MNESIHSYIFDILFIIFSFLFILRRCKYLSAHLGLASGITSRFVSYSKSNSRFLISFMNKENRSTKSLLTYLPVMSGISVGTRVEMESHDEIFDNIMERAGDDGRFQKRFNYIFNVGMAICASLCYMNVVLALNVPEHWCLVPGREQTNYTVEKWKELTLPRYDIAHICTLLNGRVRLPKSVCVGCNCRCHYFFR